jgi:predicted AlkP superfamily pyrophosphatase or phosphodiesterase
MRASFLLAALALAGLAAPALRAQDAPRDVPPPPHGQLVCLVVIDQFRGDYLERFRSKLAGEKFWGVVRNGAWFTNARYKHATTQTGPGHAAIATGTYAYANGIVGNHWIDRDTKELVYCTADPAHKALGAKEKRAKERAAEEDDGEPGARPRKVEAIEGHMQELLARRKNAGTSPKNLRQSTIGDELVISRGAGTSRVVSVSVKDRAAILMGGRLGKAYWWDPAAGGFTTSTYYAKELPGWASAWNAERPAERLRFAVWDRLFPEEDYRALALAPGDPPFPHALPGAEAAPKEFNRAVLGTPFGNDLLLDFARAAVRGEELGKRAGAVDLLEISISSFDIIGHAYGPDSQEILDMTARTARAIADFVAFLDEQVGTKNVLLVLTGDHGVSMTPEMAVARGFQAGRIDPKEIAENARVALLERFEAKDCVLGFVYPSLYLDRVALAKRGVDLEAAEREVAAALRRMPGIAYAYTHADLVRGIAPANEVGRAVALAFDAARSGDVELVAAPFWYLDQDPHEDRATHGTPWNYDNHVPILLYGRGVRPGRYERRVSPTDIAPTIARLLGTELPSGCDGEPLGEALSGDW